MIGLPASDLTVTLFRVNMNTGRGAPAKAGAFCTSSDRTGLRCLRCGDNTFLWHETFADEHEQFQIRCDHGHPRTVSLPGLSFDTWLTLQKIDNYNPIDWAHVESSARGGWWPTAYLVACGVSPNAIARVRQGAHLPCWLRDE